MNNIVLKLERGIETTNYFIGDKRRSRRDCNNKETAAFCMPIFLIVHMSCEEEYTGSLNLNSLDLREKRRKKCYIKFVDKRFLS